MLVLYRCGFFNRSVAKARSLDEKVYKVVIEEMPASQFRKWVREYPLAIEHRHTSSPVVTEEKDGKIKWIGGNDRFQAYI